MELAVIANPEEHERNVKIALMTSLYPGAKEQSVDMVLAYCRAAGLDPLTKPVHIVPMSVKIGPQKYEWRDVVMPGIELYRTKAATTQLYAGQDECEFGPDKAFVWKDNGSERSLTYPEWARVVVYRLVGGKRCAFHARVFWLECYATASKDTAAPNSMWRKRPYGQLEKCAEAAALRKAFPEAIGAHQTMEEMYGKELVDAEDEKPEIAMPRAKEKPIEGEYEVVAQDKSQAAAQQAQPQQQDAGLTQSMQKILNTKLASAGLTMDDLTQNFGVVTVQNINKALQWVKENASGGAQ